MANVSLLTIGDEVVNGFTINTNASYLSQKLKQHSYTLINHFTVRDNKEDILQALEVVRQYADIIIITGGLGPTEDDLTKSLVAQYCGVELAVNQKVYDELYARYGDILTTIENQATQPKEATLFSNKVGTAYGFAIKSSSTLFIAMPGVPTEMQPMFENQVIPFLKKGYPTEEHFHRLIYSLGPVKESVVNTSLVKLKQKFPYIDFGIYISLGTLAIHILIPKDIYKKNSEIKSQIDTWIKDQFSRHLYATQATPIENVIASILTNQQLTLSCAESCTGGRISSRLTALSGASNFFLGGITAYSNPVKNKILNVKKDSLDNLGAVSETVAIEMAQGARLLTGSDYCISTTGIAGPTGESKDKPIGLVHFAIAGPKNKIASAQAQFFGDRNTIIERASSYALTFLYQMINSKIK